MNCAAKNIITARSAHRVVEPKRLPGAGERLTPICQAPAQNMDKSIIEKDAVT